MGESLRHCNQVVPAIEEAEKHKRQAPGTIATAELRVSSCGKLTDGRDYGGDRGYKVQAMYKG